MRAAAVAQQLTLTSQSRGHGFNSCMARAFTLLFLPITRQQVYEYFPPDGAKVHVPTGTSLFELVSSVNVFPGVLLVKCDDFAKLCKARLVFSLLLLATHPNNIYHT